MTRSLPFRPEVLRYHQPWPIQLLIITVLSAVALLLCLIGRPVIGPNYMVPFIVVAAASAWIYGLPAGVLATAFGTLLVHFFFLTAPGTMLPADAAEFFRLCVYVAASVAICALIDSLARGGERLNAALASIADGVLMTDRAGTITYVNPAAAAMLATTESRLLHKSAVSAITFHGSSGDPKNPAGVPIEIDRVLREGIAASSSGPAILEAHGGAEAWVDATVTPVRNVIGRVTGSVIVLRDITKHRQLQTQLSQSEKMEAVARLAGGVAGDFNNLLTVITGYGEMIRADLPAGDPLHRFTDEILFSSERAAGLARQLLAFSRGQSGKPRLLNLNELFAGMETMLKRLLGEKVQIVILAGPGVGRVSADPAQIEQLILNLAMNSRDAMPYGGRFVIETSNADLLDPESSKRAGVEPGNYVMLAVSDTGSGMDAETRARLFEPFFTTKVQGKGSGLGLSIVYGIVQQSKGHITVFSQPDAGTIFEIYFPVAKEIADSHHLKKGRGPRGVETILVADDEDGVRKLVIAVLVTHGYNVLEASNGQDALQVYEAHRGAVDLVISDIVMPKMDGYELVQRLTTLDPQLKILYMSGFRESHVLAPEPERQRPFLGKPFTPNTLLSRVREVLDGLTAETLSS